MDIATGLSALSGVLPIPILLLLLGLPFLFFYLFRSSPVQQSIQPPLQSPVLDTPPPPPIDNKPIASPRLACSSATHNPHYLTVLKGFSGNITCVAVHPQHDIVAVSCSGDRSIRVFDLSTPAKLRDNNPPYVRCAVEGDFASTLDFSHDGAHILAVKDFSRTLIKLKIAKDAATGRPMNVVSESSNPLHRNRVRWLSASKGNWVVTCSEEDDTEVKIWSHSGNLLASYTTKQVKNFQMAVSPMDGKFIGVAAWAPGVKLMEIVSKASEFSKLDKAMDLKTSKGVKAVCISADNKLAYTVDKGGVHTLWNIDVRYQVHEDPKVLLTYEETDPRFSNFSILAFAPDNSRVIGVADNNIKIINPRKPEEFEVIESAHGAVIETIAMTVSGKFFVTGAGDNRPRLWTIS
eukprot:GHVS01073996.1.p1 GENE.GHVS01073996.1~~GHVS01073996.1.p1  ORF type:complete len:406 (+),score=53.18 GHVS01073996.1:1231-2448(+)